MNQSSRICKNGSNHIYLFIEWAQPNPGASKSDPWVIIWGLSTQDLYCICNFARYLISQVLCVFVFFLTDGVGIRMAYNWRGPWVGTRVGPFFIIKRTSLQYQYKKNTWSHIGHGSIAKSEPLYQAC